MCKNKVTTVAYGEFIGARHVAWVCRSSASKDYQFLSDKQVKAKLQAGELVNGLTLDGDNNVCIDKTFTKSLMGKSGLTFSPIMAADDDGDEPVMNKYYALVKVEQSKDGKLYHFITNRCGPEIFDETQLKAMLAILDMGGVQLDEKGDLRIHEAVEVEGAVEAPSKATGGSKGKSREAAE